MSVVDANIRSIFVVDFGQFEIGKNTTKEEISKWKKKEKEIY